MATVVTNKKPTVLGKPNRIMFDVLKEYHNLSEDRTCMIGDRLDTDIRFGIESKMKYTMVVLSGITQKDDLVVCGDPDRCKSKMPLPSFYCQSLSSLASFLWSCIFSIFFSSIFDHIFSIFKIDLYFDWLCESTFSLDLQNYKFNIGLRLIQAQTYT